MNLVVLDHEAVARLLDPGTCIRLVREAMIDLSRGRTRDLPRQIVPLDEGRAFGVMQGSLGQGAVFGAKLVSVFPENFDKGLSSHQGIVALFDPSSGAPVAIVDAGEITAIRTAAASAVATNALARPDAGRLAVLGYGEQAQAHIRSIALVRPVFEIMVWGRNRARREAFAERMTAETGIICAAADSVTEAVAAADIICTTTAASEPILRGAQVAPGTHVNLVGSSRAGPAEADDDLVARARFFADHRDSVERQGAEYLNALAAGRIGSDHIVAEIGEVLDGRVAGRLGEDDVTVYKSLGHIVQDLCSAWHVYRRAAEGALRAVAL